MSNSSHLAVFAAFVGVLLGVGVAPAKAVEPSAAETCRILAPRYEPKTRSASTEAVKFLGGARLHRPVAPPCPPSRRPLDA